MQVKDGAFNSKCASASVRVIATPTANLRALQDRTFQATCTTSAATGLCQVTLNINVDAYFDMSQISSPAAVNIVYRFDDQRSPDQSLGDIPVKSTHKETMSFANNVAIILPEKELFRNDVFTANVYGNAGFAVATFTLKFAVDSNLVITGIATSNTWSASVTAADSRNYAINAQLSDPTSAQGGIISTLELLCTVSLRVTGTAALNQSAAIAGTIEFLSNVQGDRIKPNGLVTPTTMSSHDRRGLVVGAGQVHISDDYVTGFLAYASRGELVNTAVLSGTTITSSIAVWFARLSGSLQSEVTGRSCSSDQTHVLQVSGDCSMVYLDGTESAGAAKVTVTVVPAEGAPMEFYARVWAPKTPITMTVGSNQLKQVSNWKDQDSCNDLYQTTTLAASAVFVSGALNFTANILRFIAPNLQSANSSVATLTLSSASLQVYKVAVHGVTVGTTALVASGPGGQIGSVAVTVTEEVVTADSLVVTVIQSLALQGASSFSRYATEIGALSLEEVLTQETQTAYAHVVATFSDGKAQTLTSADGITMASLKESVFTVSDQIVTAVGTGNGFDLQVNWTVPKCHSTLLAQALGRPIITLPEPIAAQISGVTTKLALAGDAASVAGVPTSSAIAVVLQFDGTPDFEMTTDKRTIFDVTHASGLFEVDTSGASPRIVPNVLGLVGEGILIVRFSHNSIQAEINLTIVKGSDVVAVLRPFPSFGGSSGVVVTVLSRYAGTQVYQEAQVAAVLRLSDGVTLDVSTSAQLSVAALVHGTGNSSGAPVALGASGQTVLVRRIDGIDGAADIMVTYAGVSTSAPPTVNASDSVVNVTSFLTMGFVSTFAGVPSSTRQITMSAAFTDGTQRSTLFSSGTARIPGLLTFTSSTISAATVDEDTGVVTLQDNHHQTLTVTATAAVGAASRSFTFSANLIPAVGDIDLGGNSNAPLAAKAPGTTFTVPVTINTGSTVLGAIDLNVVYDKDVLLVKTVVSGSQWGGGTFLAQFNDPPGVINFGGTPSNLAGTKQMAVITFEVKTGTGGIVTPITGSVTVMSDKSLAAIGTQGRSFIAGQVKLSITGGRRRRAASMDDDRSVSVLQTEMAAAGTRLRRATCGAPPCDTCDEVRHQGDTNGDCIFDINDVLFTQNFLAASVFDKTLIDSLRTYQHVNLDADFNGVIDPTDAFYLARVNFKLLRFVTGFSFKPVADQTSDCMIHINISMALKGGIPAPADQTIVFLDIESDAASTSLQFQSSTIVTGETTAISKGAGFNGGFWKAAAVGNGIFQLQAFAELVGDSFGLSIVQATTDAGGLGDVVRTSAMFGLPIEPFAYPSKLAISVPVGSQSYGVTASDGYNPLYRFNNSQPSSLCVNLYEPEFGAPSYTFTLSENNQRPFVLVDLNATDNDVGASGDIIYDIVSVTPGSARGLYSIDQVSRMALFA